MSAAAKTSPLDPIAALQGAEVDAREALSRAEASVVEAKGRFRAATARRQAADVSTTDVELGKLIAAESLLRPHHPCAGRRREGL